MNFTNEQLTKAKQAKSAEELLAMAKESGIEMTEDEAKKYFAELHKEGELSDDELVTVAGGDKGDPDPKYQINDRVWHLNRQWTITEMEYDRTNSIWTYTLWCNGEPESGVWETNISGLCD